MSDAGAGLQAVFEQAQQEGRIGPGPIERQIEHAEAFAEILRHLGSPQRILDLGSGGGLPGLVLAALFPTSELFLLDGRTERAKALDQAVQQLDFPHVEVLAQRAETAATNPQLRASMDAVVARSFGRPAVTAESAVPFLVDGGYLVVADPPAEQPASERWPSAGCALLGLEILQAPPAPFAFTVLRRVAPIPDRLPRRVGIAAKRPMF